MNTNRLSLAVLVLMGVVVMWLVYACFCYPRAMRAPRMMSRVVDGDTFQPVADAKVHIDAEIIQYHFHGSDSRTAYSYDTTTDHDGRFVMPAWGPIPIPWHWTDNPATPSVHIEKEGYGEQYFGYKETSPNSDPFGTVVIEAAWDHKTILMHKMGVRHPTNGPLEYAPLDES